MSPDHDDSIPITSLYEGSQERVVKKVKSEEGTVRSDFEDESTFIGYNNDFEMSDE